MPAKFFQYFCIQWCMCSPVYIYIYICYVLQAILLLAGAPRFLPHLSQTLKDLASDESPRVRHTVASGYHEVVLLLGDKSMSAVGIYQNLLHDKSIEVRMYMY